MFVQVHVRHWPCARAVVACVCGVAMREDQAILAVDMCQDGILRPITYDSTNLLNGAGITKDDAGNSYKVVLLSMFSVRQQTAGNFHWVGHHLHNVL